MEAWEGAMPGRFISEQATTLATDTVKRVVENAGLKGFYFTDAEL